MNEITIFHSIKWRLWELRTVGWFGFSYLVSWGVKFPIRSASSSSMSGTSDIWIDPSVYLRILIFVTFLLFFFNLSTLSLFSWLTLSLWYLGFSVSLSQAFLLSRVSQQRGSDVEEDERSHTKTLNKVYLTPQRNRQQNR